MSSYSNTAASAASQPGTGAGASAGSGRDSTLAASLSLLATHDTQHKIRDLLPCDTTQRTELLLSLLKTSYTSSLHSSDMRFSALQQELISLRAQHVYVESKLRAMESLADEAGKAADESKKRCESLLQDSMRLKAENQSLRAENAQLANFKSLLLQAAAGMGSGTGVNQGLGLPAGISAALFATGTQPALPLQMQTMQSQPMLSNGTDFSQQQQQQQQQPSNAYFLSPLKPSSASRFLGADLAAAQQQQTQQDAVQHRNAMQSPLPSAHTRVPGAYVHVMPSPLSADALASPMPAPHASPFNQQQQQTQTQHQQRSYLQLPPQQQHPSQQQQQHASNAVLDEINAHLSSSRGATASPSPSPSPLRSPQAAAAAAAQGYSGSASSFSSSASQGAAPSAFSSHQGLSLVEQARSLFQQAQSRLPQGVFAEFVALVQQFRQASLQLAASAAGGAGGADGGWEAIRSRAQQMLAPFPDIYALFEQLLHATQMQQAR